MPDIADNDSQPAVARLSAFGALDPSELDDLRHVAGHEREMEAGEALWQESDRLPGLFLLLDGWMGSVSGAAERARLFKVHLPGDVLGLPSLAFRCAVETAVALTRVRLRPMPLHSFGHIFEAQPRIAAMLFLVSQEERMDLTDRLLATTRGSAKERAAALFLKLYRRMERSFPHVGDTFHVPLTKDQLADLAALPPATFDAALAKLRDHDVVGWSRQRVAIIDMAALVEAAGVPTRELADMPHWLPSNG